MEKDNFNEKFRNRLKKIIGKKIETTMIFPLSQFEMAFGSLWGDNKPEEELTQEQKNFRTKWQQCRTNILNNGNQQKRNAYAEIDMHDVKWNRYHAVFIPRNINNE